MIDFKRIAKTASSWWSNDDEPGLISLNEENRDEIADLLMGHKVVKADDEHLLLDDGTVLKAVGHDGGCSCGAGDYDLSVLNGVDNIITKVEFDYSPEGDDSGSGEGYYRIWVYAEDQKINLMQVDGTDGNGYYGTGYGLLVRRAS
jgi:hypothetical protein